jgi:hypothetical protein
MKMAKIRGFLKTIDTMLTGLHSTLHSFVLSLFKNVNRRVRLRLPAWKMNEETSEHVNFAIKVFKKMILPVSIIYVSADFYFLGRNALDSALWGLLVFFYSNFLPDLPSIFRERKEEGRKERLPWYKRYALLLFAPLFILLLFSGQQLGWKTTESFHNFSSVAVYGAFLLLLGFMLFGNFPISLGRLTEILSLSFYGVGGYLTHLKVDRIW